MNPFRADLHCHSHCSDGSDSPLELLQKAKEVGLQGISITDHDTVAAYTPELFACAQKLSIALLPGVEISSEMGRHRIHILGYGYDLGFKTFASFLAAVQKKRFERNLAILSKLAAKNMKIEQERITQTTGRMHIANILVEKGYVSSVVEAFANYLKDGGSCFVSGYSSTPLEVITQIHMARGKAVLAHPHFLKNRSLVQTILRFPFDGIECYYAKLAHDTATPWLRIAQEKKWIATGGSDYHGLNKPHIPLGASWVGKEIFDALH